MTQLNCRIWNPEKQEMTGTDLMRYPNTTEVNLLTLKASTQTLMEGTNILDVDGLELYEGDIVRVGEEWSENYFLIRKQVIQRQMATLGLVQFQTMCLYDPRTGYPEPLIEQRLDTISSDSTIKYRVLGNQFETPTLLKTYELN